MKLGCEMIEKEWYVVHTYSGSEKKFKANLEEKINRLQLLDSFGEIFIPTENVIEISDGKKRVSTKKFFPGYVLVEMSMNPETRQVVREIPKVTGFLGGNDTPAPLSDDEVGRIVSHAREREENPREAIQYNAGDVVRIIDGPFLGFNGLVDEVNYDQHKVKVLVSIFGRETPVELGFMQVEMSEK